MGIVHKPCQGCDQPFYTDNPYNDTYCGLCRNNFKDKDKSKSKNKEWSVKSFLYTLFKFL